MGESWLSKKEVAAYLQMSERWVDEQLRGGRRLPGVKLGTKWRFNRGEVDAWVKGLRREEMPVLPAPVRAGETQGGNASAGE
jgi:excisionase family DNA binding protein